MEWVLKSEFRSGVRFPDPKELSATHLDRDSSVSSTSGDSQLQGAAVFKALVQGGFELHPDGVGVVLLRLTLVAAHHLKRHTSTVREATVSPAAWGRAAAEGPRSSLCEPGQRRASSGCCLPRSSSLLPGYGRMHDSSAAASGPNEQIQSIRSVGNWIFSVVVLDRDASVSGILENVPAETS